MKLVGVEFKKNGKQYTFNDNDLPLKEGDRVIWCCFYIIW